MSISSPALRESRSVSTDAEGRWAVGDLPAGRFTVAAAKAGYVRIAYGQTRPFEAGKPIEVDDGGSVEKLDLALPRGGAITGFVADEFGEPVGNALVSAVRYRFTGGQRRLMPAGATDRSDDRGQFRLHGLPPGDYYVSVRPASRSFLETADGAVGYAETFHPGALRVEEATRLHLAVGQEAQNILITLAPTRVATLSGTVVTSTGAPVTSGMVWLHSATSASTSGTSMQPISDGTWRFSGVVPGDYFLGVQYVPNLMQLARMGRTGEMNVAEVALVPVTVTGENIEGLPIVTAVGGRITGRVGFEGDPPPPATGSIRAVGVTSGVSALGATAPFAKDWSFSLSGLSGRLLLRPSALPPEWMLASVTAGGADVTDSGLVVAPGEAHADVEVVFTRDGAELSGTVEAPGGTPTGDYAVVLFASDEQRRGWQSRFVRTARPDQTGRFTIAGLPAASYLAVALDYLEAGQETDTEFLARIASLGTTVQIRDGEKRSVTLQLSPQ